MQDYFRGHGWDEKGVPTPDTIYRLNLGLQKQAPFLPPQ